MFEFVKRYLLGKDITPELSLKKLSQVEEFYDAKFNNVRFRLGGLLPKIIPWNYAAIVFRYTINYRVGWGWLLNDDLTLAEELWHVMQWRRYGSIRLPIKYIIELRKNTYAGNCYEIEAKQMARDFLNVFFMVLLQLFWWLYFCLYFI